MHIVIGNISSQLQKLNDCARKIKKVVFTAAVLRHHPQICIGGWVGEKAHFRHIDIYERSLLGSARTTLFVKICLLTFSSNHQVTFPMYDRNLMKLDGNRIGK